MSNSKALLLSKTFWFGALQIALGVYSLVTGMMTADAAFALIVTGMTSIGLRSVTSAPVAGFLP